MEEKRDLAYFKGREILLKEAIRDLTGALRFAQRRKTIIERKFLRKKQYESNN